MRTILLFMSALALGAPAAAAEPPVDVMVLGTYHFGNPGLDTNNIKVDSVLTAERQAQLDAVARALLAFRPTRVMVEMESDAPDLATNAYAKFTMADLKTAANEIDQIGFRVAKMAGLTTVEGIDEQPKAGEPDYYPYDKLQATATKFGQSSLLVAANAPNRTALAKFEADQKTQTVAQLLARVNSDPIYTTMAFYYNVLAVGDNDTQTGADLNAGWYLRNAKIFAKLMRVAKPGDRILVVYGGGHGYWLRHFATNVPGYRLVDPVPYLNRAATAR
jgi:Family of unknown function (DUF5694)